MHCNRPDFPLSQRNKLEGKTPQINIKRKKNKQRTHRVKVGIIRKVEDIAEDLVADGIKGGAEGAAKSLENVVDRFIGIGSENEKEKRRLEKFRWEKR